MVLDDVTTCYSVLYNRVRIIMFLVFDFMKMEILMFDVQIMHAKSCSDLYRVVGEDFWLATWCNSTAFEG